MSFNSIGFLPFITAAAAVSYCFRPKLRNPLLLLFSLAFYGLYGVEHLPFLIFSISLTYLAARLIGGMRAGHIFAQRCALT